MPIYGFCQKTLTAQKSPGKYIPGFSRNFFLFCANILAFKLKYFFRFNPKT